MQTLQAGGNGAGNHLAQFTSVKAAKTTVTPGETIALTYTWRDRDGNGNQGGDWHCSSGTINGTGLNAITWTAPAPNVGRLVKPGFCQWTRTAPDQVQ